MNTKYSHDSPFSFTSNSTDTDYQYQNKLGVKLNLKVLMGSFKKARRPALVGLARWSLRPEPLQSALSSKLSQRART
ncbi:MAG: hypothetical protein EA369_06165 [Bradymonadales bacterium]|nr:MAG: hypothetical protein EA369_06165 [Bradymonadales bacterium]